MNLESYFMVIIYDQRAFVRMTTGEINSGMASNKDVFKCYTLALPLHVIPIVYFETILDARLICKPLRKDICGYSIMSCYGLCNFVFKWVGALD